MYVYENALAENACIAGELIKCHKVDTRLLKLFAIERSSERTGYDCS
jgi:hypothetical protein